MAGELEQRLDLDASGMLKALAQLDGALKTYTQALQLNMQATTSLNSSMRTTQATVNAGISGMQSLAAQANNLQVSLKGANTQTQLLGISFGSLAKIFGTQLALRGLGQITSGLTDSVRGAGDFEKAVAQITTITDAGSRNLDVMAVSITNLANAFGKNNAEVAEGAYQAVSNQVGNTAETLAFLNTALEFSKAAVTSLASSVDTLSGVQKAYSQTSSDAQHNADVLFRVIDLGRVTADELGDSFGRITPLAAQLGVSLEEVGAAIAASTVQGVNFRDAQTQLLNLLVEAIKPTSDFKKRMDELGFATAEAGIAARGFVGFFSDIADGAKSSEELAKLFNNIRGLRGQISIFARDGKLVKDALDQINNSAGATRRAFEQIQFTNAVTLEAELNKISNTFQQGFGRNAIAAIVNLTEAFGGLATVVEVVGTALAISIGATLIALAVVQIPAMIAGVVSLTAAIGAATSSTAAFTAVLAANPAVLIALGVGFAAAILVMQDWRTETEKLEAAFSKAAEGIAKATQKIAEEIRQEQTAANKGARENIRLAIEGEEQRQTSIRRSFELANAYEKATTKTLETEVKDRLSAVDKFYKAVEDAEKKLIDVREAGAKKLADVTRSIQEARFGRRFEAADTPLEQQVLLQNRFNKLIRESSALQRAGDSEGAQKVLDTAASISSQWADITGSSNLENKLLREQAILIDNINNKAAQQVAAAKKVEEANRPIIDQIKVESELTNALLKERQKALAGGSQADTENIDKQLRAASGRLGTLQAQFDFGNLDKKGDVSKALAGLQKLLDTERLNARLDLDTARFDANIRRFLAEQTFPVILAPDESLKALESRTDVLRRTLDDINKGESAQRQAPLLEFNLEAAARKAADAAKIVGDEFGAKLSGRVNGTFVTKVFKDLLDEGVKLRQQVDPDTGLITVDAAKRLESVAGNIAQLSKNWNFATDSLRTYIDSLDQLEVAQRSAISNRQDANRGNEALSIANLPPELVAEGAQLAQLQKAIDSNVEAINATLKKIGQDEGKPEAAINKLSTSVQTAIEQLKTAIESGDSGAIDRLTEKLNRFGEATGLSNEIENIINGLNSMQNVLGAGDAAVNQLSSDLNAAGNNGVVAGQNIVNGLSGIGSTAAAQVAGVLALAQALQELAAANAAAGGAQFARNGAHIQRYANGGQARGSDRISAALSPGEIVLNPSASRKFYSQVMPLNRGATPRFNTGGAVGDTFGDVSINIDNRNTGQPINGREIYRQIKREARRGTIGN